MSDELQRNKATEDPEGQESTEGAIERLKANPEAETEDDFEGHRMLNERLVNRLTDISDRNT